MDFLFTDLIILNDGYNGHKVIVSSIPEVIDGDLLKLRAFIPDNSQVKYYFYGVKWARRSEVEEAKASTTRRDTAAIMVAMNWRIRERLPLITQKAIKMGLIDKP